MRRRHADVARDGRHVVELTGEWSRSGRHWLIGPPRVLTGHRPPSAAAPTRRWLGIGPSSPGSAMPALAWATTCRPRRGAVAIVRAARPSRPAGRPARAPGRSRPATALVDGPRRPGHGLGIARYAEHPGRRGHQRDVGLEGPASARFAGGLRAGPSGRRRAPRCASPTTRRHRPPCSSAVIGPAAIVDHGGRLAADSSQRSAALLGRRPCPVLAVETVTGSHCGPQRPGARWRWFGVGHDDAGRGAPSARVSSADCA